MDYRSYINVAGISALIVMSGPTIKAQCTINALTQTTTSGFTYQLCYEKCEADPGCVVFVYASSSCVVYYRSGEAPSEGSANFKTCLYPTYTDGIRRVTDYINPRSTFLVSERSNIMNLQTVCQSLTPFQSGVGK